MSDLDLFVRIARLHPNVDGWCPLPKAQTMAAAVLALRPDVTVEIGIYGGKSFLPMALAHKEIGHGVCLGIDPWNPTESAKDQEHPADRKYWGELNHEAVMNKFFKLMNDLKLHDCTKIIRQPSDQVIPPENIGILSLDGNHGEASIRDAKRFGPKVRVGGLVFVDDIGWTGGKVRIAVHELIEMGFKRMYDLGSGIVMQRT